MTDMTSIDSLLDANLDDLADLPAFEVPPPGAYRASIVGFEKKQIGTHPAVEIKLRLLETLELTNPSDTPVKEGTECSVAYMLDNEFGQGNLKKILTPLAVPTGCSKLSEIMAASAGLEVMVVTKKRSNKEKTQEYLDIYKIEVL